MSANKNGAEQSGAAAGGHRSVRGINRGMCGVLSR